MRESRFNVLVRPNNAGSAALFNTLTGGLTQLDAGEVGLIERALRRPDAGDTDPEVLATLVEQGHLVDEDLDEYAMVEARKRAGVLDPNRLDVIIMPTLSCNFDCVYCYEDKHPSRMSDATEDAIKNWLSATVPTTKLVVLHWFGGEPLLEHQRMVSITRHLAETASRAGVGHASHVTTNGYLLDADRRRALLAEGIFDYQVTIDGPPDTHDALRPHRAGHGSFDRVFENVCDTARADPRVHITVRVNFNHTNLDRIPELLERFDPAIRPQLRVVYEPIFGADCHSATGNLGSASISDAIGRHYRLASDLGFDVSAAAAGIAAGKLVYCYAERENQVVLNYNGDVFKCSVTTFEPEDRLGYLEADGTLVHEAAWRQWATTEDLFASGCQSCVYLPLCMGGCRKTRLAEGTTGSFCALIPTNASYILKQIAFAGFDAAVLDASHVQPVHAEQPVELRKGVMT